MVEGTRGNCLIFYGSDGQWAVNGRIAKGSAYIHPLGLLPDGLFIFLGGGNCAVGADEGLAGEGCYALLDQHVVGGDDVELGDLEVDFCRFVDCGRNNIPAVMNAVGCGVGFMGIEVFLQCHEVGALAWLGTGEVLGPQDWVSGAFFGDMGGGPEPFVGKGLCRGYGFGARFWPLGDDGGAVFHLAEDERFSDFAADALHHDILGLYGHWDRFMVR